MLLIIIGCCTLSYFGDILNLESQIGPFKMLLGEGRSPARIAADIGEDGLFCPNLSLGTSLFLNTDWSMRLSFCFSRS